MLVSGSKSPFSSKVLAGQDIIEHGSLGLSGSPEVWTLFEVAAD